MRRAKTQVARLTVIALCLVLAACRDEVLLDKLDQHQANQTLSALQRRNIPARKIGRGKAGYDIVVSHDDFAAAVDTLDSLDLPPRPRVEISQAFPGDAMVASPTAERARLLSLTEQRLEQTLSTIDLVDRASVHISYPIDDSGSTPARPLHIAALVVHEPGIDEQELIAKLKRFLRNAVTNTSYDDISITLFESPPHQINAPSRAASAPLDARWLFSVVLGSGACIGLLVVLGLGIRSVVLRRLTRSRSRTPVNAQHAGLSSGAAP